MIKTLEDIKKELKNLDVLYYEDKISLLDYENAKEDLYKFMYKLEKSI